MVRFDRLCRAGKKKGGGVLVLHKRNNARVCIDRKYRLFLETDRIFKRDAISQIIGVSTDTCDNGVSFYKKKLNHPLVDCFLDRMTAESNDFFDFIFGRVGRKGIHNIPVKRDDLIKRNLRFPADRQDRFFQLVIMAGNKRAARHEENE